jgi:hypothetical protein
MRSRLCANIVALAEGQSNLSKRSGIREFNAQYRKVLEALLVPILAQNRFTSMTGRFVASSPAFLWKAAALRREADLTRQIAHEQLS